jgi:hypothetical protein
MRDKASRRSSNNLAPALSYEPNRLGCVPVSALDWNTTSSESCTLIGDARKILERQVFALKKRKAKGGNPWQFRLMEVALCPTNTREKGYKLTSAWTQSSWLYL